jgi:hypothetical protein
MVDGPVTGIDAFGAGSAIGAFRFADRLLHRRLKPSHSRHGGRFLLIFALRPSRCATEKGKRPVKLSITHKAGCSDFGAHFDVGEP